MTAVSSLAAALVLLFAVSFAAGNSLLFQANANGSAVVLEAIGSIQQSGVFGDDNEMLRRIAYVETRDGTQLSDTGGGIWAVSESRFLQTQNLQANVRLPAKLKQIQAALQIDWLQAQRRDLCEPLYSAIAARLVLYLAPRAIPAANDLEAQAKFWVQYYNTDGNEEDFTAVSSGLQGSILDSSANEFFLGFSLNYFGDERITLHLFVTTTESSPVRFTMNATGFSYSGIATHNSSTNVMLPHSLQVRNDNANERDKGIYVKAEGDKKIVVYGLTYHRHSTDAFLALPCNRLPVDEYEYYAATYTPLLPRYQSAILIVGCEDNTVVNTGQLTSITLNRLQTYLINSIDDLTGRRITSNKPIALFSNNECANVPVGVGYCDHLTEQIPPTATWGRVFLAASLLGRRSGELFRIVAAQTPTNVTVNCTTFLQPVTYSLTAALNWQEFEITPSSFCSITSTGPILVTQFSLGADRDLIPNNVGDPFIMMLPPVEQFSNNYVFNVLPTFVLNYITVYVSPEYFQPDRIFVDSTSLDTSPWSQIYCSSSIICGYITRVNLTTAGEHRLYHLDQDARVGVSTYGFNPFNSYGYPGGLKLTPVQLATVSFSSATYQYGEGTGDVQITITRSGNIESKAIVLVASDNFQGTATAGEDFKSVSSILEFQPGETEKRVTITINDDKKIERDEFFQLYLSAGEGIHLTPFARAEIMIVNNDGAIKLDPPYGNMLGGTAVMVSGTRFMIKEDDDILCIFDGIGVRGVYVDGQKALCISPLLSRTGRLPFQILVNGSTSFSSESVFTSLSVGRAHEVYLANTDQLFLSNTEVNVQWSPESIFPMEAPDSYEVDIHLLELSLETGTWARLATLGTDLPNNGTAAIRIPSTIQTEDDTFESAISSIVIQVSLSANSTGEGRLIKRGIFSDLLRRLGRFGLRTIRNSPMRFLMRLARQAAQRVLCETWSAFQPRNIGQEILNRLPPCPRRVRDARRPNSGFTEERFSSHIPIVGTIQNYLGTTLVDDAFRNFFHPGTASCFRQRVTDNSLTGGSGQQCCYDENDLLVTGPPGGGTVDHISPDVNTVGHFVADVLPFLVCCKAGIFSNCEEYYRHRPSDLGVNFSPPPPPPIMWGDPHILTHDGHKYTFNGKGEFILIQTLDDSFSVQARMVPVNNTLGEDSLGTVFTAIVSQERDSDRVQFEVVDDEIIVLVNGEEIDFTIIKEQEFSNVTIYDLENSTLSASFSTGAYIEAREENGFFSLLIVSLPEMFKDKKISGLMGSFNGEILDDLLPIEGTVPLSLNSTIQEIHEKFGLTWIVDTPVDSLFTYQPGETWATFYDPFFQPTYEPKFSTPELEAEAKELCGDDNFCLFDVAATGNMEIGLSTLMGGQEIEEITEVQIPVVCDPPCVNGVCVENDTCHCAIGYEGSDCSQKVVSECEENPCQNGGTCSLSAQSYTCSCPEKYTGALCQDVNCPPLCTPAFCTAKETRKALCTIPNPSENFTCSALCRITFCTTCYYAEEPQPRPPHCDAELCPYYPDISQAANRCFKRWSICTRRSKYNELRGRKQKTPERFRCYEHPCV